MSSPRRLILAAVMVHGGLAGGAEPEIDAAYPGGNIVCERVSGDNVYLRQDLRDTSQWWFSWNFRVRGAVGRTLTFHFTNRKVFGPQGPAVSLDEGRTWRWLGGRAVSGSTFSYEFAADADSVRFGFAMPYQAADLDRFLAAYDNDPCLAVDTLCEDRRGRVVERLRVGKLAGEPDSRVLMTCRHHACETSASWVFEGVVEGVLADSDEGRWFRRHVELMAIPFMDKDGVEDGDQGKLRRPHDHARDYAGDAVYPSVRALKACLPDWADGRLRIAIDLHCPYLDDEKVFWVLNPEEPWQGHSRRFLRRLADGRQGPLPYAPADDVLWPTAWGERERTPLGWFRTVPGVEVAMALEIPYASVGGVPVNPDNARAFGRDIARAIADYLRSPAGVAPRR